MFFSYLNKNSNPKRYKIQIYYKPKGIWYKEIKKLTTDQGEECSTWCLLDYDYIKTHNALIAVDFSRQKQLHADSKAIQQLEIVGQLKNTDGINNGGTKSMFF